MNKPASMSLTDWFIKKTSLKTLTSETIVDAVIKHQWKAANEATKPNTEVEISGIGKFYTSNAKIRKRVEHLERIQRGFQHIVDNTDDERKRGVTQTKLNSITTRINELKAKLNEN